MNQLNTLKLPVPYEPKLANRFLVTLPDNFDLPEWTIFSITKPKLKKDKWQNITIVFTDPIGPSTSQRLFHNVSGMGNAKAAEVPFDFKIESLDPTGVVVEKWTITVEKIVLIDFGDSNYAKSELQKPRLIVKPSTCVLNY